jgi:[ribosomal protein S5]-alanine N-acetyltransferase
VFVEDTAHFCFSGEGVAVVMNVPRIETERYVLQLITPEYASALLEYYLRNRKHLEPWEPERSESYYTLPNMKIQAQ